MPNQARKTISIAFPVVTLASIFSVVVFFCPGPAVLTVRGQLVEGAALNTDRTVFIGLFTQLTLAVTFLWLFNES